jgi:hypothetical protein
VLTDHPIGYWPLNEEVPNVYHDISGNAHDTSTGGVGCNIGVTGLVPTSSDLAAIFKNVGTVMFSVAVINYVNNSLSVEAWINTLDTSARSVICQANNAGAPQFGIFFFHLNGGVLEAYIIDNGGIQHTATGSGTCSDGRTHHVVVTTDGTTITLYKDGAVNGVPVAAPAALHLGAFDTGMGHSINFMSGSALGGTLDDVAVYDYALTADQVLAHFEAGTTL